PESAGVEFWDFRYSLNLLFSLKRSGLVQFWKAEGGNLKKTFTLQLNPGGNGNPRGFVDSKFIARGAIDGWVQLYDCAKGTLAGRLHVADDPCTAEALSPDEHLLVVAREKDSSGSLWNLKTGSREAV